MLGSLNWEFLYAVVSVVFLYHKSTGTNEIHDLFIIQQTLAPTKASRLSPSYLIVSATSSVGGCSPRLNDMANRELNKTQ